MKDVRVKVEEGGRVEIPEEYLRALGVSVGDEVILRLEDGEIRIFTIRQAVRRAQELVGQYVPEGRSLADELIEERRLEGC